MTFAGALGTSLWTMLPQGDATPSNRHKIYANKRTKLQPQSSIQRQLGLLSAAGKCNRQSRALQS